MNLIFVEEENNTTSIIQSVGDETDAILIEEIPSFFSIIQENTDAKMVRLEAPNLQLSKPELDLFYAAIMKSARI